MPPNLNLAPSSATDVFRFDYLKGCDLVDNLMPSQITLHLCNGKFFINDSKALQTTK